MNARHRFLTACGAAVVMGAVISFATMSIAGQSQTTTRDPEKVKEEERKLIRDVAENLKKQGGFIPGVKPGSKTAEYIDEVMSRITLPGAVFLTFIALLPMWIAEEINVPFRFGGTSLLIVVGVALDTVQQIESHLITRNYEGFSGPKGPRIRGRVPARPR